MQHGYAPFYWLRLDQNSSIYSGLTLRNFMKQRRLTNLSAGLTCAIARKADESGLECSQ